MATLMTASAVRKVERSGNELSDVASLLMRHRRGQHVEPFLDAKRKAQHIMRGNKAVKSIDAVVMRANDSVELVRFGCRGGVATIANLLDPYGAPV